jgi:hypothetical protein
MLRRSKAPATAGLVPLLDFDAPAGASLSGTARSRPSGVDRAF